MDLGLCRVYVRHSSQFGDLTPRCAVMHAGYTGRNPCCGDHPERCRFQSKLEPRLCVIVRVRVVLDQSDNPIFKRVLFCTGTAQSHYCTMLSSCRLIIDQPSSRIHTKGVWNPWPLASNLPWVTSAIDEQVYLCRCLFEIVPDCRGTVAAIPGYWPS